MGVSESSDSVSEDEGVRWTGSLKDFVDSGSFESNSDGEYDICGESGGERRGDCEGDERNSGDPGGDGGRDSIVVSFGGGVTFTLFAGSSSKLTGIPNITDLSLITVTVVVVVVLSETILFCFVLSVSICLLSQRYPRVR